MVGSAEVSAAKGNEKITGRLSSQEKSLLSDLSKEVIKVDDTEAEKLVEEIGKQVITLADGSEVTVEDFTKQYAEKNKDAIAAHVEATKAEGDLSDRKVEGLQSAHGIDANGRSEAAAWLQLYLNARGNFQNISKPTKDYTGIAGETCICDLVVDGLIGSHTANALSDFIEKNGVKTPSTETPPTETPPTETPPTETPPTETPASDTTVTEPKTPEVEPTESTDQLIQKFKEDKDTNHLDEITTLTTVQTNEIVQFANENEISYISFDKTTSINKDIASVLANFKGNILYLDGLTSIDKDIASALANFKGEKLYLDGLTSIDKDIASALANFKGEKLSLDGLTSIDKDIASELANINNTSIEFDGIKEISEESAIALAKTKSRGYISLDGLTSVNKTILNAMNNSISNKIYMQGISKTDLEVFIEGSYTRLKDYSKIIVNDRINATITLQGKESRTYKGDINKGQPEGEGKLQNPNNGITCEGIFEEGKLVSGTKTLKNGTTLTGKFKNWRLNGEGTITRPDGKVFKGTFKDGKVVGKENLPDVEHLTDVNKKMLTESNESQGETGIATFYNDEFHGKTTASGEKYDKTKLTAAHRTLPFGTKVKITNIDNKKSVEVIINDRGPYVKGRLTEISKVAAEAIGIVNENGTGTGNVKLEILS